MNQIQKQILDILNEFNDQNPGYYLARNYLLDKLKIDDKLLEKNAFQLRDEKYVDISPGLGVEFSSVKITGKGINLIENSGMSNFTAAENSDEITTSSDLRIKNTFNQIYNTIESLNLDNRDKVIEKVSIIREELKKDEINTAKIRSSTAWLKINASWTIFPLAQVIITVYGLNWSK
ncbi:hypothetical protein [Methanobacterium sp.]|jgi:hypothetical protein|uniref:hypothetical protein n=1 Tax=Methanobacterium sp. TaxID=2164 RepID=UPI003158D9C3